MTKSIKYISLTFLAIVFSLIAVLLFIPKPANAETTLSSTSSGPTSTDKLLWWSFPFVKDYSVDERFVDFTLRATPENPTNMAVYIYIYISGTFDSPDQYPYVRYNEQDTSLVQSTVNPYVWHTETYINVQQVEGAKLNIWWGSETFKPECKVVSLYDYGMREANDYLFKFTDLTGFQHLVTTMQISASAMWKLAYDSGYNDGYSAGIKATYSEAYQDGYNRGYGDGYNVGNTDGYNQGLLANQDNIFKQGYDTGYESGYNDGVASNETLGSYLLAIADVPFRIINGMLDFEIMGFNMAQLVYAVVTAGLVIAVVKFFV